MTDRPTFAGGEPDHHGPVDDDAWVRSVVSDALMQANMPPEQRQRVLDAAIKPGGSRSAAQSHQETAQPEPLAPKEPVTPAPIADFSQVANLGKVAQTGSVEPAPVVTDTSWLTDMVAAETVAADTPAPETVAPEKVAAGTITKPSLPPTPPELKSYNPDRLGAHGATKPTTKRRLPLHSSAEPGDTLVTTDDAVMLETDASVEGYRASDMRTIVEWLLVIFLALVVAVLAKQFVVQAFWIPTASMETTVNVGDRVLVNKVSYQFNDVRRGDLVVFGRVEGTPGNTDDLIKRAIALPGETIELRDDGRLWIWGPGETPDDALLLDEPYLNPQNALLSPPSTTDGPSSTIWHENCVNDASTPARCTLDSESYFMMGDNRNQSFDSRGFGPVPDDNIVGRAFLRIWPLGDISTL